MDQYLSTVIVAVITGVVSIVSLFIQKKQDRVINRIGEQASFLAKEKEVRQKLAQKEKEKEAIIHEIMLLILDTNMMILRNTQMSENVEEEKFKKSDELQARYEKIVEEIAVIQREYNIILDMTTQFRQELEQNNHN